MLKKKQKKKNTEDICAPKKLLQSEALVKNSFNKNVTSAYLHVHCCCSVSVPVAVVVYLKL